MKTIILPIKKRRLNSTVNIENFLIKCNLITSSIHFKTRILISFYERLRVISEYKSCLVVEECQELVRHELDNWMERMIAKGDLQSLHSELENTLCFIYELINERYHNRFGVRLNAIPLDWNEVIAALGVNSRAEEDKYNKEFHERIQGLFLSLKSHLTRQLNVNWLKYFIIPRIRLMIELPKRLNCWRRNMLCFYQKKNNIFNY